MKMRRAVSVRDYLSARGVSASRISTEGRGAREPVADNNTLTGRNGYRLVRSLRRMGIPAAICLVGTERPVCVDVHQRHFVC
jgi:hypothetical protein